MDDHRVVVEPACGASLAVAYAGHAALAGAASVLVIVCGGVTATVAQLQRWSTGGA
jgi:L-serine/L-threonine ammonia-lyase